MTALNPRECAVCGRLMLHSKYRRGNPELHALYAQAATATQCATCYYRRRRNSTITPIGELIEDIEWLVGTDSPEHIARRVGYDNPEALGRRLARHGRHDLAAMFDRRHMRAES